MTIIKIDGLPDGYELRKDYMGHKFALIFRDFDETPRFVTEWREAPLPEEVIIAVGRDRKK